MLNSYDFGFDCGFRDPDLHSQTLSSFIIFEFKTEILTLNGYYVILLDLRSSSYKCVYKTDIFDKEIVY